MTTETADPVAQMFADHIEITGCDLRALVRKAYELSSPRDLGFLHFQPGPLADEQVEHIVSYEQRVRPASHIALSMDYVNGRAVKLTVFKHAGCLYIPPRWYDHTAEEHAQLVEAVKATIPAEAQS